MSLQLCILEKPPQATDLVSQLERLKALIDSECLGYEEFALAKANLLSGELGDSNEEANYNVDFPFY